MERALAALEEGVPFTAPTSTSTSTTPTPSEAALPAAATSIPNTAGVRPRGQSLASQHPLVKALPRPKLPRDLLASLPPCLSPKMEVLHFSVVERQTSSVVATKRKKIILLLTTTFVYFCDFVTGQVSRSFRYVDIQSPVWVTSSACSAGEGKKGKKKKSSEESSSENAQENDGLGDDDRFYGLVIRTLNTAQEDATIFFSPVLHPINRCNISIGSPTPILVMSASEEERKKEEKGQKEGVKEEKEEKENILSSDTMDTFSSSSISPSQRMGEQFLAVLKQMHDVFVPSEPLTVEKLEVTERKDFLRMAKTVKKEAKRVEKEKKKVVEKQEKKGALSSHPSLESEKEKMNAMSVGETKGKKKEERDQEQQVEIVERGGSENVERRSEEMLRRSEEEESKTNEEEKNLFIKQQQVPDDISNNSSAVKPTQERKSVHFAPEIANVEETQAATATAIEERNTKEFYEEEKEKEEKGQCNITGTMLVPSSQAECEQQQQQHGVVAESDIDSGEDRKLVTGTSTCTGSSTCRRCRSPIAGVDGHSKGIACIAQYEERSTIKNDYHSIKNAKERPAAADDDDQQSTGTGAAASSLQEDYLMNSLPRENETTTTTTQEEEEKPRDTCSDEMEMAVLPAYLSSEELSTTTAPAIAELKEKISSLEIEIATVKLEALTQAPIIKRENVEKSKSLVELNAMSREQRKSISLLQEEIVSLREKCVEVEREAGKVQDVVLMLEKSKGQSVEIQNMKEKRDELSDKVSNQKKRYREQMKVICSSSKRITDDHFSLRAEVSALKTSIETKKNENENLKKEIAQLRLIDTEVEQRKELLATERNDWAGKIELLRVTNSVDLQRFREEVADFGSVEYEKKWREEYSISLCQKAEEVKNYKEKYETLFKKSHPVLCKENEALKEKLAQSEQENQTLEMRTSERKQNLEATTKALLQLQSDHDSLQQTNIALLAANEKFSEDCKDVKEKNRLVQEHLKRSLAQLDQERRERQTLFEKKAEDLEIVYAAALVEKEDRIEAAERKIQQFENSALFCCFGKKGRDWKQTKKVVAGS